MTELQDWAVMVLCARDADVIWQGMSAKDGDPTLSPPGAAGFAYLTSDRWTPLAQIRCDDLIIAKGVNCYYGLLLQCDVQVGPVKPGDFLLAVRGTMDPLEWINDAMAIVPRPAPDAPGMVGAGFWDIYASMTLASLQRERIGAGAAAAIAGLVGEAGGGDLHLVGHSLGAALATYLAADLTTTLAGAGRALHPYLFASPRPGSADYGLAWQTKVRAYALCDYAADLVPQLPPPPLFATLPAGGPDQDVFTISSGLPGAPPSSLVNNHSPVTYARLLDPANLVAQSLPLP